MVAGSDRPIPASDLYPTFSDTEFARRAAAVRAAMDASGVECVILYGAGRAAEVQYLSSWPGSRESYLVFPRDGAAVLLVQLYNHVPNARRTAVTTDVRWAGSKSADGVADALTERGAANARIGIVGNVPWLVMRRLAERLPRAKFVEFGSQLRTVRTVMSDEELVYLREAARLTDLAMVALEREVHPGLRESELAVIVEGAITSAGGTPGIHFMATTPMHAPQIGVPAQIQSSRVIEEADVLITEITAQRWGYGGQIHRAYAIATEPTNAYRRIHEAAVETYRRICGVLRDGATVAEVLDAAEVVHERGYTVYDDLLHGTNQLPPIIQTRRTARHPQPESFVFRENMVVVVQPNVTSDEHGTMGLQVGETVRVTGTGIEPLHNYPMRFVICR